MAQRTTKRDYYEILGVSRSASDDDIKKAYRRLADEYFETDRYQDFCASRLGHLDELILDWVASGEFDALLVETVRTTYPPHEHEQFVAHFRGLVGQWLRERGITPQIA